MAEKKEKVEVKSSTVQDEQKLNKDGFVAGQEVDSKSYFEFLAKQRNS